MSQLTTKQAIAIYSIGGAVACLGAFYQIFLQMGFATIFTISIFLTFMGD